MEDKMYYCSHWESFPTKKAIRLNNPHKRNLGVIHTEFGPNAGWEAIPNPEWDDFENEAQKNVIMVGEDFIKNNVYYEHQIDFSTEIPTLKPYVYFEDIPKEAIEKYGITPIA